MLDNRNLKTAFVLSWLMDAMVGLMTGIQGWVKNTNPTANEIVNIAVARLVPLFQRFNEQIASVINDGAEDLEKVTHFGIETEGRRVRNESDIVTRSLRSRLSEVCGKEGKSLKKIEQKDEKTRNRIVELLDLMRTWRIAYFGDENAVPEIVTTNDVVMSSLKWVLIVGIPEIIVGALITAFMSDYLTGIGLSILMVFSYTAPALFGAMAQALVSHFPQAADRFKQIYGTELPKNKDGQVIVLAQLNPRWQVIKRAMFWIMTFVVLSVSAFRAYTWWTDTNSILGFLALFITVILGVVTYVIYFYESGKMPDVPLAASEQYAEWQDELDELQETPEDDEEVEEKKGWFNFSRKDEDESAQAKQTEYEKTLSAIETEFEGKFEALRKNHAEVIKGVTTSLTNLRALVSSYDQARNTFKSNFVALVNAGMQMLPSDLKKETISPDTLDQMFDAMFPVDAFILSVKEELGKINVRELAALPIPGVDFAFEVQTASASAAFGMLPSSSSATEFAGSTEVN